MRGRAITVALPALVVLALVAVVAVAATGSTPSGSGASRPPSKSLLDTLFTLYLVAIVAGGVLLVYGLMQRKAIAREIATGRYRRFSLISLLFLLGVFTALTYRGLTHWKPPAAPDEVGDPAFPGPTPFPTTPDQEQPVPYQPSVTWLPIALVVGLVVAAVVAYVVAGRRARAGQPERGARRAARARPRRHARRPTGGGGSAPRDHRRVRPARTRARSERCRPKARRDLGGVPSARPDRPDPPFRRRRAPDGAVRAG